MVFLGLYVAWLYTIVIL